MSNEDPFGTYRVGPPNEAEAHYQERLKRLAEKGLPEPEPKHTPTECWCGKSWDLR